MQIVIVIGVGRSGSTLMQRVINTMPRSNICGENHNAWLHIARFAVIWLNLKTMSREEYEEVEQSGKHFKLAWYNCGTEDTLIAQLRQLFLALYDADEYSRVGFKEIRIGQQGYDVMEAQLEFFRLLFPKCKIIFNLRDPQAILASQSKQNGEFGDPKVQALFRQYCNTHDALLWHYENWSDPSKVKQIYDYLEEPFTQGYRKALDLKTT